MSAEVRPIDNRVDHMTLGLVALAAAPLVFHLSSQSPFILPKFLYIAFVVTLLLCLAPISAFPESVVPLRRTVILPLILWLLYSVPSFPWFETTHADIREPFSLGVLLLMLALFAFRPLKDRESNLLIGIIFLVGAVEGLYGILQYLGIDLPVYRASDVVLAHAHFAKRGGTPSATFGNPNFFAEYLAGVLVLGVACYLGAQRRRKMALYGSIVIIVFAALILTGTRGAWVGS